MKNKHKFLHILFSVLLSSILMTIIDGYFSPSYFYKSIFKIILFLVVPLIYFIRFKDERNKLYSYFKFKTKALKQALILALLVFTIILIGYFIFASYIDLNQIKESLTKGINVNKDNFIYVAIYISLFNSLLEEYFFRIYAFMFLRNNGSRLFAYIFSSLMFAIYHIGMMNTWFNPLIFLLALIGLMIGAMIFNYLNEKSQSIYPSWLVHMFANFAINSIGLFLFGII